MKCVLLLLCNVYSSSTAEIPQPCTLSASVLQGLLNIDSLGGGESKRQYICVQQASKMCDFRNSRTNAHAVCASVWQNRFNVFCKRTHAGKHLH